MNEYNLNFHHFGLAVVNPKKAMSFLKGLGYTFNEPVYDPLQSIDLIWCESSSMPSVELIYSSANNANSPIRNILKNTTELIYHVCYESEDVDASIHLIKESSNRVIGISKPKPAILFAGKNVSFYKVDGFGIIEILEK